MLRPNIVLIDCHDLAPCHVLQTDMPTENILAMIDAAL